MKIDILVAEIGSTTTVVNGFDGINSDRPVFIGGAQAPTSVLDGDVRIGLKAAIRNLEENLGVSHLEYDEMLATSSAAGGLKMSVHGLVFDMTARAAKEAALGAGAIVHQVTAGKLRRTDLKVLSESLPNLILIAGGVDYGERDTALYNAEKIAEMGLNVPVIYAGNVENQEEMKLIFEDIAPDQELYIAPNVFPKIDELNVIPTRKLIQEAFEKNIVHAPGMEHVFDLVKDTIMPTPASVMKAAELLAKYLGDALVVDVGGATTDVHSVTTGDEAIAKIQVAPEPEAKRTVEGDLGVYVNFQNVVESIGEKQLIKEGFDLEKLTTQYKHIPKNKEERKFVSRLTEEAVLKGIHRHVGRIRHIYGPSGRQSLAEGKDLTQVQYVIGTGGALTQLADGKEALEKVLLTNNPNQLLLPHAGAKILLDKDYIMASIGVLSTKYETAALALLKQSFGIEEVEE